MTVNAGQLRLQASLSPLTNKLFLKTKFSILHFRAFATIVSSVSRPVKICKILQQQQRPEVLYTSLVNLNPRRVCPLQLRQTFSCVLTCRVSNFGEE